VAGQGRAKQNASHTARHDRHDDRVHDWPGRAGSDVPSPILVAAWLTLDMLPAERIPGWAASWLVDGYDGPALVELAGLHGDDPREVRDLLPAALAECRVAVPAADAAAAMEAFTHLAQLCADGKAGERWIVDRGSRDPQQIRLRQRSHRPLHAGGTPDKVNSYTTRRDATRPHRTCS
jgi:hypothetical protein